VTKNLTSGQQATLLQLVAKLRGLGIDSTFAGVEEGPVVTGYYFSLGPSTPISKVLSKSEDLALATGEDKISVQRVGQHIALFVPNEVRKTVDFKENLYWYLHDKETSKMGLPIPVGVDTRGKKSSFDLCNMPHVLIAGSTGGGKSVFTSSIISSLSYFHSPSNLQLYLVDTKKVDLPLFSPLPHVKMMADSVESFHQLAKHVTDETRMRLLKLQNVSARNIGEYRKMGLDMPYIIVILDEFADLADLDKAERAEDKRLAKELDMPAKYEGIPTVKQWLNSITRIGRAAGVHIIACTQRSSVKVVDGDIKANLPCRIALRLPTGTDSRTILGTNGAENLLGRGDMLVQRPECDAVERYHGPYVSMNDITELVTQYDLVKEIFKR
jgi:S-DNA-T family DNA segregation ATPase FtsK/SpoIIIE